VAQEGGLGVLPLAWRSNTVTPWANSVADFPAFCKITGGYVLKSALNNPRQPFKKSSFLLLSS